jgi:hypothetical protein
VMAAQTHAADQQKITEWIDGLKAALASGDVDKANAVLMAAIGDYRPGGEAQPFSLIPK